MTVKKRSNQTPTRIFDAYSLFTKGVGWIGGLGLLSTGVVWAQSPQSATTIVVPTSVDATSTAAIAPTKPTPSAPAIAPPETSIPESIPAPAPRVNLPDSPPPVILSTPTVAKPAPASDYDAPSSVVLSERSTGCQAVLHLGQKLAGGTCAIEAEEHPRPINTVSVADANLVQPSAAPVSVGPLALSASGIGLGTTSSVRDYYNRTLRPPGLLGNGNIRLIFPLTIPAPITSLFGWRVHPISGDRRFHSGTDLGAPLGTPVLAAYAGRVAIADFLGGYGLAVMLEHNKGTQETLYGHLSEIFVRPGDWVEQGTVIGRVGTTGNSTGPHLHFEFRQLTDQGWVALDAGAQLEYAMAELLKVLQAAQASPKPGA